MLHYPVGYKVRIAMPLGRFSRGVIERREGEYYYVRMNARPEALVERYQCELTLTDAVQRRAHAEQVKALRQAGDRALKRDRVLVRVEAVSLRPALLRVVVPSWNPNVVVDLPSRKLPPELRATVKAGDHLLAYANLSAVCGSRLALEQWELAPGPAPL